VLDTPTAATLLAIMEILLAAAMVYGVMQYGECSRAAKQITEQTTHRRAARAILVLGISLFPGRCTCHVR
jgi:hypothetical protein